MIKGGDIKEILEAVVRKRRGLRDRRVVHPYSDWPIVLICFVILLLAGGLYAGVLFLEKQQEDIDAYSVRLAPIIYDKKNSVRVIELYEERNALFESRRGTVEVSLEPATVTEEEVAEGGSLEVE